MPPIVSPYRSRAALSLRAAWLGAGALVLVALGVYWNSLEVPFLFDDIPAVERNPTIRHLWPPWEALNPPVDGSGPSGRPLMNLSLAVNYASGGLHLHGYHLLNLALHALAALALWGLLRRTFAACTGGSGPADEETKRRQRRSLPLRDTELFAWGLALLWAVHPLLTESVVCVVQRNEILGSLFYLLTIYCFVRGAEAGRDPGPPARPGQRSRRWTLPRHARRRRSARPPIDPRCPRR